MNTVRLLNPSSDELNISGYRFTKDATGAFNVPVEIANMVVRQPGGFYRGPDVAPPAAAPLAFNPVFNVSGGVTLADDANGRLLALEIAHFASIHKSGEMPMTDSAGQRHMLSADECRNLAVQFRDRLNAAA
jgi:hypothetical protein